MKKPVFEINGSDFESLEGFFDEAGKKLTGAKTWGRSLDAFNDILRGGFGTPEGGFVLRWTNSTRSRQVLGFPETIRYLEKKVRRCHPDNVPSVRAEIDSARRGQGQTLFDIIVEIIRDHGPGGREEEDGVELELA